LQHFTVAFVQLYFKANWTRCWCTFTSRAALNELCLVGGKLVGPSFARLIIIVSLFIIYLQISELTADLSEYQHHPSNWCPFFITG